MKITLRLVKLGQRGRALIIDIWLIREGITKLGSSANLPLALLEHQAEKDLSVPTGWKKSRHSQTATTKASQRGRALIVDMKRAVPTHSHNFQAFRGKKSL